MSQTKTQELKPESPAPGVFQGVIKEVVERVLSKQPITMDEFKKHVEDLLTQKLGEGVRVEYQFDESAIWEGAKNIKLGFGEYLDVYIIEHDDTLEVSTGLDVNYFNIKIVGKVVAVCNENSCEHVMIGCELRKVEPKVSE